MLLSFTTSLTQFEGTQQTRLSKMVPKISQCYFSMLSLAPTSLSTFKKVPKSTLCSTGANCSRTGERKGVPGHGSSKRDTEEGQDSQKGLCCQDPTQQFIRTPARPPAILEDAQTWIQRTERDRVETQVTVTSNSVNEGLSGTQKSPTWESRGHADVPCPLQGAPDCWTHGLNTSAMMPGWQIDVLGIAYEIMSLTHCNLFCFTFYFKQIHPLLL